MPSGDWSPADRLPYVSLARIFYYLPLSDLYSCTLVCRHWYSYLAAENTEVWRVQCERLMPPAALSDPYLLSELNTYKSKLRLGFENFPDSDNFGQIFGCLGLSYTHGIRQIALETDT